jgi:hypothetical protein
MKTKNWFKLLIILSFLLYSTPMMAPIIKINPSKENPNATYQDLVCTEDDKASIYEIISTMSENGKINLLLKQNRLKELGAKINHLHPMKFLTSIFGNAYLKVCMVNVYDDYFKRVGFMDGLAPSLDRTADKGKLIPYVDEFAQELGIDPDSIRWFFHLRDWDGLVRQLIAS